jgi:hypothetical protein
MMAHPIQMALISHRGAGDKEKKSRTGTTTETRQCDAPSLDWSPQGERRVLSFAEIEEPPFFLQRFVFSWAGKCCRAKENFQNVLFFFCSSCAALALCLGAVFCLPVSTVRPVYPIGSSCRDDFPVSASLALQTSCRRGQTRSAWHCETVKTTVVDPNGRKGGTEKAVCP